MLSFYNLKTHVSVAMNEHVELFLTYIDYTEIYDVFFFEIFRQAITILWRTILELSNKK